MGHAYRDDIWTRVSGPTVAAGMVAVAALYPGGEARVELTTHVFQVAPVVAPRDEILDFARPPGVRAQMASRTLTVASSAMASVVMSL